LRLPYDTILSRTKKTPHLKRIEVAGGKGTGSYEKRFIQIEWEIVITLFTFYDECRRPRWGAPAAVQG